MRRFRFAPSPNGYLHLGHAYSALFNAALAAGCGGAFLVRVEDIDRERSRPEFEQALFEDLAWLGLTWEKSPRRQSEHLADYRTVLESLRRRGLAYPCFCSRGAIAAKVAEKGDWPRDPDGSPLYPGTCRSLSEREIAVRIAAGEAFAVRLDMDRALAEYSAPLTYLEFHESAEAKTILAQPQLWGDALIGRRDAPASYHIACTLDDAAQDITDVARGLDLEPATGLHRLLQALLDLPTPEYRHHHLVLDEEGCKLSKSKSSTSLRALRRQGATPEGLRDRLARRMRDGE